MTDCLCHRRRMSDADRLRATRWIALVDILSRRGGAAVRVDHLERLLGVTLTELGDVVSDAKRAGWVVRADWSPGWDRSVRGYRLQMEPINRTA